MSNVQVAPVPGFFSLAKKLNGENQAQRDPWTLDIFCWTLDIPSTAFCLPFFTILDDCLKNRAAHPSDLCNRK